VHCLDGEQFLARLDRSASYDLILLDAFDEMGMAARLYDPIFFRRCAQLLRNDGIFCANSWSGGPKTVTSLASELEAVFAWRLMLPVTGRGNVVLLSGRQPLNWQDINRSKSELTALQHRFDLDFAAMSLVAARHNLSLTHRLRRSLDFWKRLLYPSA
jgi:spermidine synthase